MKKVDLKKVMLDLDDKEIVISPQDPTKFTLGRAVAMILQTYKGNRFDALKCLEMARTFYKREYAFLDKSDFEGLLGIIKEDAQYTPLIKGQIIEILNESPEDTGDEGKGK